MAEWYRGVGIILSSSDSEGCHTAVMEGIASGALPIVHAWPGARELFGDAVYEDLAAAIPIVRQFADALDIERRRRILKAKARGWDVSLFSKVWCAA